MKLWFGMKNFFSYFAFFNSERQLRHYRQTFHLKENAYQARLRKQMDLIEDLRDRIQALEFEKKNVDQETKRHFEQIYHFQSKLESAKKEHQETRQKLSALYVTHNKLVQFLESQSSKNTNYHASIPHHH